MDAENVNQAEKIDEDICAEAIDVKKSDSVDTEKGAGIFSGIFNLANAALGAGVLTFPDQFARTSLIGGVFLNLFFVCLVITGLNILAQTAKLTSSDTLPVAVRRLFGKSMERLAIVLLIAYCWCSTIQFMTTIGTTVEAFGKAINGLDSEADSEPWYLNRYFTISVVSIVFVYPLSCLKSLSNLAWTSSIAVMAVSYNTIFVLVSSFLYTNKVAVVGPSLAEGCKRMETGDYLSPNFWQVVPTIASMCLGYQCHLSSFCNYSSLKPKTKSIYPQISVGGSIVCFVTYTTVGLAGAYLFGGCTNKWVLKNYALNDVGANIGRALIAIAVAFSYPILAFTGRREILRLWDTVCAAQNWEFSENNVFLGTVNRRFFWVSTLYFFSNLICALFITLDSAIQFVGTAAASWMFIYPGFFAMKVSELTCEETLEDALSKLPDEPLEELADSWVNGIRHRVTWWLSARQRKALWFVGFSFVIFGTVITIIGFATFIYDMTQ